MKELTLLGEVAPAAPRSLSHDDLFDAPADATVSDVGLLVAGRTGSGVRFAWIVELAQPSPAARWVTLESDDGGWSASLPLEDLAGAVVVHAFGSKPFGRSEGGPFRLYVPDATDACGNVKHLGRITFASRPGADTRPPEDDRSC